MVLIMPHEYDTYVLNPNSKIRMYPSRDDSALFSFYINNQVTARDSSHSC